MSVCVCAVCGCGCRLRRLCVSVLLLESRTLKNCRVFNLEKNVESRTLKKLACAFFACAWCWGAGAGAGAGAVSAVCVFVCAGAVSYLELFLHSLMPKM